MVRKTAVISFFTIVCIACRVIAQENSNLEANSKIRLHLDKPESMMIGRYSGTANGLVKMYLTDRKELSTFPVQDVRKLEVFRSDSRSHRFFQGLRVGSYIGGGIGTLVYGIAAFANTGSDGVEIYLVVGSMLFGAVVGSALGAPIGAIINLSRETGEWETQPVDLLTKGKIPAGIRCTLFKFDF